MQVLQAGRRRLPSADPGHPEPAPSLQSVRNKCHGVVGADQADQGALILKPDKK